jgi:hypothetical protein
MSELIVLLSLAIGFGAGYILSGLSDWRRRYAAWGLGYKAGHEAALRETFPECAAKRVRE